MKEMIAEALQENAERKEKLKKQLDWRSLELVVNRKEKDKSQVSAFRACHFKNKTVSKRDLSTKKQDLNPPVLREKSDRSL